MPENESFKISHSSLKSLKLHYSTPVTAEFNTPNLQLFKYCGSLFQISTFNYCSGLLINAELKLYTKFFDCVNWLWSINNFIETFSSCKLVLTVDCYLKVKILVVSCCFFFFLDIFSCYLNLNSFTYITHSWFQYWDIGRVWI